jgi:hypothetical protein
MTMMTDALTRHEIACLQTALALVICKRRLTNKQANSKDDVPPSTPLLLPLIPTYSQKEVLLPAPKAGGERWTQHVSHMFDLAVQEVRHLQQQQREGHAMVGSSLRLDSLATHLACQLSEEEGDDDSAECTEWIQSTLLDGTKTANDDSSAQRFFLWGLVLCAKPTKVAKLLVPILLQLLLPSYSNKNTALLGHVWNLLEAAVPHASAPTCRDAVQSLLVVLDQSQGGGRIQDLAGQYAMGTNVLTAWAAADLLQRLVARLSRDHS